MVAVPRQESPWDGTEKCSGMVYGPYDREGWEDPFFEGPEEEAVAFCRGSIEGDTPCPQLEKCLIFALLNNERDGVWAASPSDRKAIRKRWPLKRGKLPRPEWKVFPPGEPTSWFAPEELEDDDEEA